MGPATSGDDRVITTPAGYDHPMVLFPGGSFLMGSDEGSPNQHPMRTVITDSFLIDAFETTNEQFSAFLNAEWPGMCSSGLPTTTEPMAPPPTSTHPVLTPVRLESYAAGEDN